MIVYSNFHWFVRSIFRSFVHVFVLSFGSFIPSFVRLPMTLILESEIISTVCMRACLSDDFLFPGVMFYYAVIG